MLVLAKRPCLSAYFCASCRRERADALVDPLGIVVPPGGRAEFGRDDDDEVVAVEPFEAEIVGEARSDVLGEGHEVGVGLQAGDVEQVEAGLAETGANLADEGLAGGAGEIADLRDDETEDGQGLLDLECGAELGREGLGEVDHAGQAHVGLVDTIFLDGFVVGHLDEGGGVRSMPAALKDAVRKPSTTRKTFSCEGKDISRSIWVNSG